jgi:putative phosphoribosyl transferase
MTKTAKMPERQVEITSGKRRLNGILHLPAGATGVVVFAHGSGSGRFSPRNHFVARDLQDAGLATLLLDLLEEDEAKDRENIFDIGLLAERLQAAADWLKSGQDTRGLHLGYFGASTGAGAALVAAARHGAAVKAVVSRGGRPDLAGLFLASVTAPTLLIVGGDDDLVLELNQQALRQLRCAKDLQVIPGATHLFEERGTLEEVARLAKQWFVQHLGHNPMGSQVSGQGK